MVDVGARTDLNDLLALGVRQTADVLAAAEVAVSLDSGVVFLLHDGEPQRIDSQVGDLS